MKKHIYLIATLLLLQKSLIYGAAERPESAPPDIEAQAVQKVIEERRNELLFLALGKMSLNDDKKKKPSTSKWTRYRDSQEIKSDDEEEETLTHKRLPQREKRRRRRNTSTKRCGGQFPSSIQKVLKPAPTLISERPHKGKGGRTVAKRFSCHRCPKTFATATLKDKHILTHDSYSEEPKGEGFITRPYYSCDRCDFVKFASYDRNPSPVQHNCPNRKRQIVCEHCKEKFYASYGFAAIHHNKYCPALNP